MNEKIKACIYKMVAALNEELAKVRTLEKANYQKRLELEKQPNTYDERVALLRQVVEMCNDLDKKAAAIDKLGKLVGVRVWNELGKEYIVEEVEIK